MTARGALAHATTPCEAGLPPREKWLPQDRETRVLPVVDYLTYLDSVAKAYCQSDYRVNYEDVYYLAAQIAHTRVQPNPLVAGALSAARHELEKIAKRYHSPKLAIYLPALALLYMERVVRDLVSGEPGCTAHLGLLGDACADRGLRGVSIATLNHDRVIEAFLRARVIPYVDGFERKATGGVPRFSPGVYDERGKRSRVHVLKLHGGADWNYYWPPDHEGEPQIALQPEVVAPARAGRDVGRWHDLPIQIGTHNKIANYTLQGQLGELQCRFAHALSGSDLVVSTGYGFGDAGINARLDYWLSSSPQRRVVIIDPFPDSVERNLGGRRYSTYWYDWERQRIVLQRRVEETSWADVLNEVAD